MRCRRGEAGREEGRGVKRRGVKRRREVKGEDRGGGSRKER